MAARLYNYKRPQGSGLPWLKIIRDTNKYKSDRAGRTAYVKVVGLRGGRSRTTHLMTFVARTSSPELYFMKWVVHQYATTVVFIDDTRVKLSCSCPDFKFMWEWGLWRAGSAEMRYGNGAPPHKKNPRAGSLTGSCKHTMKLAFTLKELGKITPRFTLIPRKPLKSKPVPQAVIKHLPRMTTKKKGTP
jgi:hypothetical protein